MRPAVDPADIAHEAMILGAAQKIRELEPFIAFIAEEEPSSVLEIGTMHGATLFAWCKCASPTARITSIDLPNGRWGGGYPTESISRFETFAGPDQMLNLIRGDSHDPAIRESAGGPLDFLFIDGDHTYEGVKQDFEDYSPLVRPGGIVAFHDILHHPQVPECDVDRFWEEIVNGFESHEFTFDGEEREWGPWGGIGAVRMP